MKKYSTEQRKQILEVLSENVDHQFYIEELEAEVSKKYTVSRSAIYRNISKMVDEGVIKKYASSSSRKSLYQYIDNHECSHHIHLKCSKCGKIFHLNHDATDLIQDAVLKESSFKIDTSSSVLYGICKKCS
ncbi:MAG: Fur family transcriptional regulator [Suipraeoptans sp.]